MEVDDHRYGEGTKTEMDKFMADAAHDHEIDLDTFTGGISQPSFAEVNLRIFTLVSLQLLLIWTGNPIFCLGNNVFYSYSLLKFNTVRSLTSGRSSEFYFRWSWIWTSDRNGQSWSSPNYELLILFKFKRILTLKTLSLKGLILSHLLVLTYRLPMNTNTNKRCNLNPFVVFEDNSLTLYHIRYFFDLEGSLITL